MNAEVVPRLGPERQCGKILIIENEKIADRMTVLLVGGSSFGF